MVQTDTSAPLTGSIADVAARLALWGRRAPKGLARVEFISDFSRQEVVSQLRAMLPQDKPLHEIELPFQRPAIEVVHFLRERLRNLTPGTVSITGFATAFSDDCPLADCLRVLNFHRDNLAQFPLCQIWWMTCPFAGTFLRSVPDLNSWFLVRLKLSQVIADESARLPAIQEEDRTPTDPIEARKQAAEYAARFEKAIGASSPVEELVSLAGITANILHNAHLKDEEEHIAYYLLKKLRKFFRKQGQSLEAASPLFYETREWMQIIGSDFFGLTGSFKTLAQLYESVGDIAKAEEFFMASLERAKEMAQTNSLSKLQNVRDPWFSDLDSAYHFFIHFYIRHAQHTKAEMLCRQWVETQEATDGTDNYHVTYGLIQLAKLYVLQCKYADVEALYYRILSQARGGEEPDRPVEMLVLKNIVILYRQLGRNAEAEVMSHQASMIQGAA